VVPRTGVTAVRPADEIDPAYGAALRRASAAGVEMIAYTIELSLGGLRLGESIRILL